MADLRSYMSTEFFEDSLIINDLEQHMKKVAKTFGTAFDSTNKSWPYELRPAASPAQGQRSQSTRSMILSSILAMREEWGKATWKRAASGMEYAFDFRLPKRTSDELKDSFTEAKIIEAIQALVAEWGKSGSNVTKSTTFGRDDPMSLGWSLDLIRWARDHGVTIPPTVPKIDFESILKRILRRCGQRAERLAGAAVRKTTGKDALHRSLCASVMSPNGERNVGDSSYILARFAAVARAIVRDPFLFTLMDADDRTKLERSEEILLERFEARLHDHLSFAEIEDSRFDPTELAFCLACLWPIQAA
jgi:hypothetical protein